MSGIAWRRAGSFYAAAWGADTGFASGAPGAAPIRRSTIGRPLMRTLLWRADLINGCQGNLKFIQFIPFGIRAFTVRYSQQLLHTPPR